MDLETLIRVFVQHEGCTEERDQDVMHILTLK